LLISSALPLLLALAFAPAVAPVLPGPIQGGQATDRPADPVAVCVVAPRVEAVQQGDAIGVVPTPRPVLLVVEPLLEIRLERAGRVVWRRVANPGEVITGPMAWPGLPLAPGEVVLLRLRPEQAGPGSFAHVQLIGGSAARMAQTARLMAAMAQKPSAWLQAVDAALDQADVPLAWTLLFAPNAPLSPELQQLRNQVLQQGCGE
jgi:hypothetical protein